MFRRRFLMAAIVAGIATLAEPSTSEGAFKLRLSDDGGATWTTITDGGAGDDSGVAGVIQFSGDIGNWVVNVTTGLSKPLLDPGSMDLNSVNVSSSGGPATLTIELTDTDFVGPSPGQIFAVGGTANGSVSFEAGGTNSNTEFDLTNSTGVLAFGSGAFSTESTIVSGSADPYSLTIRTIISHGSGTNSTSFNAELSPVPAPAGLILAATALPFIGLLRRRLRRPEATTAA